MSRKPADSSPPSSVPEFQPELTLGEIFAPKNEGPVIIPPDPSPGPAFVMVDADEADSMTQMDIEQILTQNKDVRETPPSPPPDILTAPSDGNGNPSEGETAPPPVKRKRPGKKLPEGNTPEGIAQDSSQKAIAQGGIDGEILPRQLKFTSRIEIVDAHQYTGQLASAPEWIDRNWIGYADTPDLVRGIEPGPCLRVPTYRGDTVVARVGDYVVRQTMRSTKADESGEELRLEVWGREDFERLFIEDRAGDERKT